MFLSFNRVTKFYGPVIGLNDISCRIGPGITGLFGANGAGKSTLLKLIPAIERPSAGSVLVNGQNVGALKRAAIPVRWYSTRSARRARGVRMCSSPIPRAACRRSFISWRRSGR